jgi:hypothetical protein
LDGTLSLSYGPHCLGRYDEQGDPILNLKPAAGKAVEKTRFSTALGNPAKCARFPLSHRLGGYGRLTKPDISLATKTGHFNLVTTEQRSTMSLAHDMSG